MQTGGFENNHSWQIPISLNDFRILSNNESLLCEIFEKKFDCLSVLESPVQECNSNNSLIIFRKMLIPGLELSVWNDDLTRHAVDVVVNAANEDLLHCGGLAGALVKAGGYEIQRESNLYISHHGKLPVGEIAVTEAYQLPCKYIIHAVGPLWNVAKREECIHLLEVVIKNILNYVTNLPNIKTVAIPAISSGIFAFPLVLCTKTIVETISSYFQDKRPIGNLKEIHLVSNEDPTVYAFQSVSELILKENKLESGAFAKEIETIESKLKNYNYKVPQMTEAKIKSEVRTLSTTINLMGSNLEKITEAEAWIQRILTSQEHHIIENNNIFYLGKKEYDNLSRLQNSRVSISETINAEKAIFEIKGCRDDLIEVVMNIELVLCEVQEERTRKKEDALCSWIGSRTNQQPKSQDGMKENKFLKCIGLETAEIQDRRKQFENCGLRILKVEKIDNRNLETAFQNTKKMMEPRTKGVPLSQMLFQRVPYQFCDVVCRVGFQRMYSMSYEPKLGAGIYFTKNLKCVMHKTKETSVKDKLIYIFEAEVLTGSSCKGHPSNIVAPPLHPGDIDSHDSVVDIVSSPETFVIFNTMQALPKYLWTCAQDYVQPQSTMLSSQHLSNVFSSGIHVYQTQFKGPSPYQALRGFPRGSSVDYPPYHLNK
ncbi:protein mono-ADP-ribosyltransferase PARP9 [Suncus etruscus]|uniref:protein mono-ADP-ribosyltransferase PARP9 n=1 Tax=Suncus etruscus TaxID=109475 RepID=UPI00210F5587|nr:protein mono-ADP-ribosyltransferase PARP9 [Suncus etruscus]